MLSTVTSNGSTTNAHLKSSLDPAPVGRLIESTFGESRRRTKVIGRLPGDRSCVTLVWAVLDRQSRGWRGVTVTPRARRRLQDLRRQLSADTNETDHAELEVSAAA
jgi:hypothetical protein